MTSTLPASPNLDHLKKQAKDLLRDARAGEAAALQRFIETLPAAHGLPLATLAQRDLVLSDAQSVLAREYGFKSWVELTRYVEWKRADRADRLNSWLKLVYEDGGARERRLAVRMLREDPDLTAGNPLLACAIGDEAAVRRAISEDPAWVNRKGGAMNMPPLIAVTHSRLILESAFESSLLACAALLIEHGADVNATRIHPDFPGFPLSVLYGAAGITHHVGMTRLLLAVGASPDDNESLYHSVESPDSTCTHLLLEAGAKVAGTNAIAHLLDYGSDAKLQDLKLALQYGLQRTNGKPFLRHEIHHAIVRGRSIAHIRALIDAGADLRAVNHDGVSLYRYAQLHGRADVLDILREAGISEPLTEEEQFVAACARADEAAARDLLTRSPNIFLRLTLKQLQTMPELAAAGQLESVRTMLALGWPREVKVGWDATALNWAVFHGNPAMAELLLQEGADWQTRHGYRNNVIGTLAHSSRVGESDDPAYGDYVGCAHVLVAHGIPLASFEDCDFAPDVSGYLDSVRLRESILKPD
jgi:hypothetical protein